MNFIYFFMKCLPANKNKILFLSRQSNTPTEDFMFLEARLRELKPELKTVKITKRADKSFSDLFVFALQTLRSMFHLATASVCAIPIGLQFRCSSIRIVLPSFRYGTQWAKLKNPATSHSTRGLEEAV